MCINQCNFIVLVSLCVRLKFQKCWLSGIGFDTGSGTFQIWHFPESGLFWIPNSGKSGRTGFHHTPIGYRWRRCFIQNCNSQCAPPQCCKLMSCLNRWRMCHKSNNCRGWLSVIWLHSRVSGLRLRPGSPRYDQRHATGQVSRITWHLICLHWASDC